MNANEEVFNDFFDAFKDGHLDRVTKLIANGFNIEANDSKGWTALHHASEHGHLEIVKYLFVTCHVNMEAKTNYGITPLNCAIRKGRLDIVNFFN
jgi:ankyrin repeat protein